MTSQTLRPTGQVMRIAGPVVGVVNLESARLFDVAKVGKLGLVGEVIRLSGNLTTVQVYEETAGLRVGEPVVNTGAPLVAQLGPGLLGQVYDGLQRPLSELKILSGAFIERGVSAFPVPEDKPWQFTPHLSIGDLVQGGDILGTVPETPAIEHRVMVPPGITGQIADIRAGEVTLHDVVALIQSGREKARQHHEITLVQSWPVRKPRPYHSRLETQEPLITGTRVIDAFYPVAKGGTAIVPGGFGTGKTVIEQSLARWAEVDIVIYVGCGERGNEIADVLEEFPQITDPFTGLPLMNRTILIANTSNMPVAAREASIYTGITLGEYYRDMGYNVLLLADSTSRWGEALREISGRLEEIPGEEGYPAYLGARLSEFYERSGRVNCLGNHSASSPQRVGSLTLVGAVSPPGGDFSEPITQSSMSVVGALWALDYDLSRRRHFPAISWTQSYTLYDFKRWYAEHVASEWDSLIQESKALLQRADELQEIVQLVGPEALSESEHLLLLIAQMIQEDFLQQSLFEENDRFSPLDKSYWMIKTLLSFYHCCQTALGRGMTLDQLRQVPGIDRLARMKEVAPDEAATTLSALCNRIHEAFDELGVT